MGKKYIVIQAKHLYKMCILDIRKVHSIEKKKTPKLPKFYEGEETHEEDGIFEEPSMSFNEKLLKQTL